MLSRLFRERMCPFYSIHDCGTHNNCQPLPRSGLDFRLILICEIIPDSLSENLMSSSFMGQRRGLFQKEEIGADSSNPPHPIMGDGPEQYG